jgi:Ca2+-binding RTX toxin-like protein
MNSIRRNVASRRRCHVPAAAFEALESRQLFDALPWPIPYPIVPQEPAELNVPKPEIPSFTSVRVELRNREVTVEGGIFDDTIEVSQPTPTLLRIRVTGVGTSTSDFYKPGVDRVRINGNYGNDTIMAVQPWAGDFFRPATLPVLTWLEIDGGEGDDRIRGGEYGDNLRGGDGNDTFFSSAGPDRYEGGAGADDVLDRTDAAGPLTITLDGIGNDGLTDEHDNVFGDVETIVGGRFDDYIANLTSTARVSFAGAGGNDILYGGPGGDNLNGGEGNDNLHGGAGNDVLIGMAGNDRAFGGAGDDTFLAGIWAGTAGTTITVGASAAPGVVGQSDVVHLDVEHIVGSHNADTIIGSVFNDDIHGGDGDDTIFGNGGDDNLLGEGGSDTIIYGD